MAEDKIFADGFIFKRKDNAPEFVIGAMSVKVDEAISFLKEHQKNGWVNLDVKQSKSGKYYLELDTWVPKPQNNTEEVEQENDDLPF
jgi:hypothetical protein